MLPADRKQIITLINPPIISAKGQSDCLTPPLGISYLASYMAQRGREINLIDGAGEAPGTFIQVKGDIYLRGLRYEEIVDKIDPSTSLIGISNLFSNAFPIVKELCFQIKKRYPNTPLILGGNHPTNYVEGCLRETPADYVATGEGELGLEILCDYLAGNGSKETLEGICYLENGKLIKKCGKRLLDLNADTIPFPARHLLPMENYIRVNDAHGASNGRWTPIITSRGCPFSCTFCSSRLTKMVYRSAIDVVNEIEHCIDTYGITEFHFEDDNLTIDKRRTIEVCEEILRRNLKITWQTPNGIRASVTDPETLAIMRKSGCTHIILAPESGSKRVLGEIIRKDNTKNFDKYLGHIVFLAKEAHKLGLRVGAFFIIGCPGETKEDVLQTIDYACKLARAGVEEVAFNVYVLLPGTPLWDVVVKEGIRKIDFLELAVNRLDTALSWSTQISNEELHALRVQGNRKFLLNRILFHPLELFRTVWNVLRGVAESKSERSIRTIIAKLSSGSEPSAAAHSDKRFSKNPFKNLLILVFKVIPLIFLKRSSANEKN